MILCMQIYSLVLSQQRPLIFSLCIFVGVLMEQGNFSCIKKGCIKFHTALNRNKRATYFFVESMFVLLQTSVHKSSTSSKKVRKYVYLIGLMCCHCVLKLMMLIALMQRRIAKVIIFLHNWILSI